MFLFRRTQDGEPHVIRLAEQVSVGVDDLDMNVDALLVLGEEIHLPVTQFPRRGAAELAGPVDPDRHHMPSPELEFTHQRHPADVIDQQRTAEELRVAYVAEKPRHGWHHEFARRAVIADQPCPAHVPEGRSETDEMFGFGMISADVDGRSLFEQAFRPPIRPTWFGGFVQQSDDGRRMGAVGDEGPAVRRFECRVQFRRDDLAVRTVRAMGVDRDRDLVVVAAFEERVQFEFLEFDAEPFHVGQA